PVAKTEAAGVASALPIHEVMVAQFPDWARTQRERLRLPDDVPIYHAYNKLREVGLTFSTLDTMTPDAAAEMMRALLDPPPVARGSGPMDHRPGVTPVLRHVRRRTAPAQLRPGVTPPTRPATPRPPEATPPTRPVAPTPGATPPTHPATPTEAAGAQRPNQRFTADWAAALWNRLADSQVGLDDAERPPSPSGSIDTLVSTDSGVSDDGQAGLDAFRQEAGEDGIEPVRPPLLNASTDTLVSTDSGMTDGLGNVLAGAARQQAEREVLDPARPPTATAFISIEAVLSAAPRPGSEDLPGGGLLAVPNARSAWDQLALPEFGLDSVSSVPPSRPDTPSSVVDSQERMTQLMALVDASRAFGGHTEPAWLTGSTWSGDSAEAHDGGSWGSGQTTPNEDAEGAVD
ncbi:MAG TPA: hypothetical protein VFG87_00915, partial [Amycolatopsis sp.]|nr:hypothetical protein [Amycolatopsis sp.]